MLILLLIVFALVAIYFMYVLREIHLLNEQMRHILTAETNAELTTSSRNRIILRHVNHCNELIQRNKEMKRQQQLNERELHQILTSLTHDLRTPLTVASGYTQLLLQDDSRHELAVKISNSLDSVNYYLTCLTDYNLIQEKRIMLSIEKINYSQLLMEHLFQYYEEFEQKGIHVHLDVKPNLFIHSDKLMLKRIIDNIVSNLLKYAKGNIEMRLVSSGNHIEFICQNDYDGEMKDPNLLMMRFQTMDDSRQNKSMGIGLHIIQELADILNGTFKIEIEPGVFKTMIVFEKA